MPTAKQVADKFDKILRNEIGEDNYRECVAKNKTPAYQNGCCASHDYCDSNMVMLEALQSLGADPDSNEGNTLWNRAWDKWRAMTR
jgi:hypothetical protein